MKRLVSSMSGGQKGFTLIELLVVIAILGVIAAVVALNIAGFFGRGTLQAANTELHQAQTAIIAAMADAGSNQFAANTTFNIAWAGEENMVLIVAAGGDTRDASTYVYGPFRAVYSVDESGGIVCGWCNYPGGWGAQITWNDEFMNWETGTGPTTNPCP